jgi:hypothetical protein
MKSDDARERLSAVAPKDFVATRNRLVAELRQAGRPSEAHALAGLRRPTPALWAVNRLAVTAGKELEAFLDTVDRLRRSQLRDPRAAAESLREQRAALDRLVARARELLRGIDLRASAAVVRRISDTLLAAAVDRSLAGDLRRGRLTAELTAPGFDAFEGARVPASPLRLVSSRSARPAPQPDGTPAAAEADRRASEIEALDRKAAEQQQNLERLEAQAAEAQARLAALRNEIGVARAASRRTAAAARRARRTGGGRP